MTEETEFSLEEKKGPIPGTKNFWIKFTVEVPYPKEYEFVEKANQFGTAINRAFRKCRKELKGAHISEIRIIVRRL